MNAIAISLALSCFVGQAWSQRGQRPSPGQTLFEQKCANCHADGGAAAGLAALRSQGTERVFDSLMTGKMKDIAAGIGSRERRLVAEFVGQRPWQDPVAADVSKMKN